MARAVHEKGAALDNVWGFVDGTVRPISRPKLHQNVMYNGHKRVHAIKWQAVNAAIGLIVHLDGAVEGKRHDAAMLMMSALCPQLEGSSAEPIQKGKPN
ncbi:Hypothetical predicted protein [Paramuricea clavata]|uniref:Uncharacterized protein n=1 Tax=Paramuricea clavata TaxID=317549 RepID=A0A7D9DZK2_PARCT|nr:Hypothetical predicted protein [Paramuricea clavata]